jgi:hypothetical protein
VSNQLSNLLSDQPAYRPGAGPRWTDPRLNELAAGLREAHRAVAGLTAEVQPRLTRQLLVITELAKRDPDLAGHRLRAFLAGLAAGEYLVENP